MSQGSCLTFLTVTTPGSKLYTTLFFYSHTGHLDIIKVLLPTDAQENCFKWSIKIYIKTAPVWFQTVQHTYTTMDLITYAATPPD